MGHTVLLGEPPAPVVKWLERRRALGQDLFDEVWEGEHHVASAAHARHGDVDDQVASLLRPRARNHGLWPTGSVNIGRPNDYRVPDRAYLYRRELATFLPTAAIVVEIVSPGDESYAKFGFYFASGVQEVLILDPERRAVEWYGRGAETFERLGGSELLNLSEADLAAGLDWPPS